MDWLTILREPQLTANLKRIVKVWFVCVCFLLQTFKDISIKSQLIAKLAEQKLEITKYSRYKNSLQKLLNK